MQKIITSMPANIEAEPLKLEVMEEVRLRRVNQHELQFIRDLRGVYYKQYEVRRLNLE